MQQVTFVVSGVEMINFNPSALDDQVNNWTSEHPGVEVVERHLHTSTTTFQQGGFAQTVITLGLMLVYREKN